MAKKEEIKLPVDVEALQAENVELKSEIERLNTILKRSYSVTVKGWYNGNPPNSLLTINEEEYIAMKKSGVIY